jgi:hypothetical protein
MSLRKINRERMGGHKLGNPFAKKSHFKKLGKKKLEKSDGLVHPRKAMPKAPLNKTMLQVLAIAAVAIIIIAAQFLMRSSPAPVTDDGTDVPTPINETNDSTPIVINETKLPDLEMRSVSLSSSKVNIGDNVTITASLRNRGEANASDITMGFFAGQARIGTKLVVNLSIGETTEVELNWSPGPEHTGSYKIRAVADPDDLLDEERENNNEADKSLTVEEMLLEDASADFKRQATVSFNNHWYSDTPNLNNLIRVGGGDGYTYFQVTNKEGDVYYLDIMVPGFKLETISQISGVFIPSASSGGWNSRNCIKETLVSSDCIWNGPQIRIDLAISSRRLEATDQDGQRSYASTSKSRVKDIKLVGLKKASWPGELRTWKVLNAKEPEYLVPLEFYETVGNSLYLHPLRWSPKSFNAEAALWFRFEITLH